ncbi:hypothetical protein [Tropicimonas sp. S265A]|uniref:hypothetical protein n=1 Tax=Tropicimonas sp. S265A TaxID=3415134 RepID=UPI003C7C3ED6
MSRSAGATATRINSSVGTVLYSGAPRDYISCALRGDPVNIADRSAVLDIRTTVAGVEDAVRLNTQYVVTATSSDGETRSIAFREGSAGTFDDGVRCSSTGAFEETITGQQ